MDLLTSMLTSPAVNPDTENGKILYGDKFIYLKYMLSLSRTLVRSGFLSEFFAIKATWSTKGEIWNRNCRRTTGNNQSANLPSKRGGIKAVQKAGVIIFYCPSGLWKRQIVTLWDSYEWYKTTEITKTVIAMQLNATRSQLYNALFGRRKGA